ncbi:MAG: DUF3592 domain-containing protein [Victivallales bacterium]|nr:DUF3592 domain-containing protein [Victivallales bacterium]
MLKQKKVYFIGLLMVLGILASIGGVIAVLDAKKTMDWPVVQGVIIDSFVSCLDDSSANQPSRICLPDVKYEYVYKKNTFFNNDISYFPSKTIGLKDFYYAALEGEICEFVKEYPVNAKVSVHVNPMEPESSVLDTTLKLPVFLPLICGVLLIYTACHLFVFHTHYFSDPY